MKEEEEEEEEEEDEKLAVLRLFGLHPTRMNENERKLQSICVCAYPRDWRRVALPCEEGGGKKRDLIAQDPGFMLLLLRPFLTEPITISFLPFLILLYFPFLSIPFISLSLV